MKKEIPNVPLPNIGQVIEWSKGDIPPHEVLVLFFEVWWSMKTRPASDEYRLLYIALSEILPRVEWPKEQFKFWVNKYDQVLITKYATFKRKYLDMFGPMFDAGVFVKEFEKGNVSEYMDKVSRQEQAEQTRESEEQARVDMPNATDDQIGKHIGVTGQHAGRLRRKREHEMNMKSTPKLLNHGGNRDEQGDNSNLAMRGNSKPYILARLERDGHQELADQVKEGVISARKASIEAGFKKPESPLAALKRLWKKLNEDERQAFESWIKTTGATHHAV